MEAQKPGKQPEKGQKSPVGACSQTCDRTARPGKQHPGGGCFWSPGGPAAPPASGLPTQRQIGGTEVGTHSDGGRGGVGVELNANEALEQLCF